MHVHGTPRQILVLQDVTNVQPLPEYSGSFDSNNYEGESDIEEDVSWDSILDIDNNVLSQAKHKVRDDRY